jgi:hypothetical protein
VFFLPAYAVAAVWIALGISRLVEWAKARFPEWPRSRAFALASAASLMVLMPLVLHFKPNDQRHNYLAEDWGRNILRCLKPDSIILPTADHSTFPLLYLQEVEGLRRDVVIGDSCGVPGYVELTSQSLVAEGLQVGSLHISRDLIGASETLKPLQDGRVAAPRAKAGPEVGEGSGLGEGGTFRFEIDGRIPVRRLDTRMAEPVADRHEIDARLEKVDRCRVPERVRMHPLRGKGRGCGSRDGGVLTQQVAYSESGERSPALVSEQRFRGGGVDVVLGE